MVYGGSTCTTTDIAVAAELCSIGDFNRVKYMDAALVNSVVLTIRELLEDSIDQVKVCIKANIADFMVGGYFAINNDELIG